LDFVWRREERSWEFIGCSDGREEESRKATARMTNRGGGPSLPRNSGEKAARRGDTEARPFGAVGRFFLVNTIERSPMRVVSSDLSNDAHFISIERSLLHLAFFLH
jgi:hypothetical protein